MNKKSPSNTSQTGSTILKDPSRLALNISNGCDKLIDKLDKFDMYIKQKRQEAIERRARITSC